MPWIQRGDSLSRFSVFAELIRRTIRFISSPTAGFFPPRAKIHAARPTNWNSNGITGFPLYSLSSFRPYSGSFPGGRLVCSVAAARGLKRSWPNSTLSSLTTENEQHRWSAKLLLPTISLRLKLTTDYCLPSRLRLLLFLSLLRWFWFHSFYEVSAQADLFSTVTQTNIAHRRRGENVNYVSLYLLYMLFHKDTKHRT